MRKNKKKLRQQRKNDLRQLKDARQSVKDARQSVKDARQSYKEIRQQEKKGSKAGNTDAPPPVSVAPPTKQDLEKTFESAEPSSGATPSDEYTKPKNKNQLLERQEAAGALMEAMKMSPGSDRADAIARASMRAEGAGVSPARIDRFVNEPEFAKAESLRRVRAAGERAVAEGKKPYDSGRPKISGEKYAEKAAEARAQGYTGVKGDGGLAELYQMQADKAQGVAPGTFTALAKGSKRIAPEERIRQRLASKVERGELTPKGAGKKLQQIQDKKLAYDDPRGYAEALKERAAAIQEAIRTGSPLPKREVEEIEGQLSEYDKRRLERQRNNFNLRGGITGVLNSRVR